MLTHQHLVTSFITYLTNERRLSNHTIIAYKTDLTQFSAYLSQHAPNIALVQVSTKSLRQWIMDLVGQKLSSNSINRKVIALRSFFKFLQKQNYAEKNPVLPLTPPQKKSQITYFFTRKRIISYTQSVCV